MPVLPRHPRAWAPDVVLGLCAALAVSIWVLAFASRGHMSGDHGVKLAQADALWSSGFRTRALPENTALDPGGRFFPYGELFRVYRSDHQGIYSIVFTALAAPAVGLFGSAGIPLLALLATWWVLIGSVALGRRLEIPPWTLGGALVAIAVLTPIGFYAGQLQEHSLAIACVTGALTCLTTRTDGRRRPALAGLLLAAAATVRPECYCAVSAGGVALLLGSAERRSLRPALGACLRFTAAALAILIPFWLLNLASAGVWDTVVDQNRGKPHLPWTGLLLLLGPGARQSPVLAWLAVVGAVVAGQAAGWTRHRIVRPALDAVSWAAAIAVALWAFRLEDHDRSITGLFATTPLALLAVLRRPGAGPARDVLVFCAAFAVQVIALDRSGTAGGLQYGARYLSPLLPVLILLAFASAHRTIAGSTSRAMKASAGLGLAAAVAVTGWVTVVGWTRVEGIARAGQAAAEAVAATGLPVIVTRRPWESQLLAPVSPGRSILNVNGDPVPLLDQLSNAGIRQIVFVARGDLEFKLHNGHIARTVTRFPGWLEVQLFTLDASPR